MKVIGRPISAVYKESLSSAKWDRMSQETASPYSLKKVPNANVIIICQRWPVYVWNGLSGSVRKCQEIFKSLFGLRFCDSSIPLTDALRHLYFCMLIMPVK